MKMDQETRAKHMAAIRRMVLERRQGIEKKPPEPIVVGEPLDESDPVQAAIMNQAREMTIEMAELQRKYPNDFGRYPFPEDEDERFPPNATQAPNLFPEEENEVPSRFGTTDGNTIIENEGAKEPTVSECNCEAHTFLQSTKRVGKFILRIVAALIVPLVSFNLIERLPIIFPLCPIWTYNGEDVLSMIGAGFVAGICFVGLSYAIIPKWKLPFAIVMSSILTAFLILSMGLVFVALRSDAISWVHWAQNITAVIGLCAAMVGIYKTHRNKR